MPKFDGSKPGPGRPKGAKNKITRAFLDVYQDFLESAAYEESAQARMLDGKAPHLESYFLNKINGKPVERHEHSGPEGGPLQVQFVDVVV